MCEALLYLLDNIYIRFGTKLYRQVVGILMGSNCAPLVADLFLFCYERDFMTSLSDDKQAEIIEVFKSTPRFLDDLLRVSLHSHQRGLDMASLRFPPNFDVFCRVNKGYKIHLSPQNKVVAMATKSKVWPILTKN